MIHPKTHLLHCHCRTSNATLYKCSPELVRWQISLRDTSFVTSLVFLCSLPFRPWSDFCCIGSIVLALDWDIDLDVSFHLYSWSHCRIEPLYANLNKHIQEVKIWVIKRKKATSAFQTYLAVFISTLNTSVLSKKEKLKLISSQCPWISWKHSYKTILTKQVREQGGLRGLLLTHCCRSSSSAVLERPCDSKLLQKQRRGSPPVPDSTAKQLCQKQCCQQTLFILTWPERQEHTALPVQMVRRLLLPCLGVDALFSFLSDLAVPRLELSLTGPQTQLWLRCGATNFSDLGHDQWGYGFHPMITVPKKVRARCVPLYTVVLLMLGQYFDLIKTREGQNDLHVNKNNL